MCELGVDTTGEGLNRTIGMTVWGAVRLYPTRKQQGVEREGDSIPQRHKDFWGVQGQEGAKKPELEKSGLGQRVDGTPELCMSICVRSFLSWIQNKF